MHVACVGTKFCDAVTVRSEQSTACVWTRVGLQHHCKNNGRTSRWEGNTKRDFKERRCSGVVSMYLAWNGDQRLALFKIVMKLSFQYLLGICRLVHQLQRKNS